MSRILYRFLLRLHPASFRCRFGGEMMSIFDEAGGRGAFLFDATGSLARQWVLRSGYWKPVVAICIGLLQTVFFASRIAEGYRPPGNGRPLTLSTEGILLFGLALAASLAVLVACITIWNARFQRLRLAGQRPHRKRRTC